MRSTGIPRCVRGDVYSRDHHCRICGSHDNLQIHHIIYRSQWRNGHYLFNLILLCERCHRMVHGDKNKWQLLLLKRTTASDNCFLENGHFRYPRNILYPDNVKRLLDYYENVDASVQRWDIDI